MTPLYFFHLDEDSDRGGTQFPHDAAAHQSAVQMLGQMIRDGTALADSEMTVTDEKGRQVVKLRFSAER